MTLLTLTKHDNGVTEATLPAPFVADLDARSALTAALGALAKDTSVRVLALMIGRLARAETPAADPHAAAREVEADVALARALIDLPMPVVAGVSGRVTAHAEIVLTADLVIAGGDALFGDDAWANGSAPGGAGASLWQAVLRPGRAAPLLFGLRTLGAGEGHVIGFVHAVAPMTDLRGRTLDHAERLAGQPDLALRFTRATMTRRLRERLEHETVLGAALSRVARLGADGWTPGEPVLAAAE